MEQDKETLQILSEGEAVANYVESQGWPKVRKIFEDKIMDLQSLMNLQGVSPDKLATIVDSRITAVQILRELITEVEGKASQHRNQNQNGPKVADDNIIIQQP